MAAFLVPKIEAVVDGVPRNSKVYQVSITPTISYRVTVTGEPGVFEDWIAQLKVVECGKFFPVGVAVHGTDRYGNGYLTVCTRLRCIVFQLRFSYGLSRDSMLFLRDVCTCYGWRTDGYNEQLRWRNQRLSLGRLTDIRAIPPPQPNAGLGFFSIMVYGDPVHEPSADWTDRSPSARMQQIGETVMEASICLIMGGTCRYAAPLNESLPRVLSSTFPQINRIEDMQDKTMYQVSIDDNQSLHVTYTNRASVLNEWLRSPETMRIHDDFIGIYVTIGSSKLMALAAREDCLVYNLSKGVDRLSPEILAIEEGSISKLVGWHTDPQRCILEELKLPLSDGRILDVEDDGFPVTHTYEDLSRLYLGYEMNLVRSCSSPNEKYIMALAVQAFVFLKRAMDLQASVGDN
ncbi:unnamed protein product [Brassica oleracea var. botrytis]